MTDLHLTISHPAPGDWYGRQDVLEALEAAGWTGDDDMPLSIVRHPSGAVWAVANESGDSGLDCPDSAAVRAGFGSMTAPQVRADGRRAGWTTLRRLGRLRDVCPACRTKPTP